MASYPPYSQPTGSPFGIDPRQQRRLLKDQVRAQRAAFRAQRDLYRQQARSMRRGSILGPLIVVAIGVTLLLIRSNRLPFLTFANWYGRWWPTLFVVAGAVMLAEWAFDQRPSVAGLPHVRRGIGGGVIVLLLCLALAGAIVNAMPDKKDLVLHGIVFNNENLRQYFGEKHILEQQVDQSFARGTVLSIDNPHGDVTIVGKSDDNNVHITVNKEIYSLSDEDADAKARRLSPQMVLSSGTLNVTLPAIEGATSDLNITVPDFGQVSVNANHGDVHISMLHAPVSVNANHGEVDLHAITGAVIAHINNSDSSFSAHDVQGDLSLKGRADDVTLSDIHGQVSLEGDFYGDTHLERLDGPVAFQTSRTTFKLAKLIGAVNISSDSEMTGNQLIGPAILRTRSRNISFERVAGDLDVSNSNGTVDVTSALPLGNVTIENSSGEVNLTVPEQAGFIAEAQTTGGSINSNFGLDSSNTDDRATLRGKVGNGSARISLTTSHADIGFHKGSVAPPDVGHLLTAQPVPPSTPHATAP